jgi:hypothetical protein
MFHILYLFFLELKWNNFKINIKKKKFFFFFDNQNNKERIFV